MYCIQTSHFTGCTCSYHHGNSTFIPLVSHQHQVLPVMLKGTQFPFVIDLACWASKREFLKLDIWMVEKIKEHQVSVCTLFPECMSLSICFMCKCCTIYCVLFRSHLLLNAFNFLSIEHRNLWFLHLMTGVVSLMIPSPLCCLYCSHL